MSREYPITPMGAPRMTRADAWKERAVVLRYRAFKDQCREQGVTFGENGASITFVLPMPESWSARKKERMNWAPHRQTPDIDNLLKAVMDAVYEDDSMIWDVRASKLWGYEGAIRISDPFPYVGEQS